MTPLNVRGIQGAVVRRWLEGCPDRFLQEIKVTANLAHPHVLPLFDSGEANGFLYYAMPFVEGESLRDRLKREEKLPVEDAIKLAQEIADALDVAHAAGIVHRDIKPENILLEHGHAVVADFGIAQAITAAGGERLTATGVAIGTVEYMSPEQAMGSADLDGRSDLYSLGCVSFEMLGGHPPFRGATLGGIIGQHLTVEPPSITEERSDVPEEVTHTLARALAKAPTDRFSRGADLAEALEAPTANARHSRYQTLPPSMATHCAALIVGVVIAGAVMFGPRASNTITPRSVSPA